MPPPTAGYTSGMDEYLLLVGGAAGGADSAAVEAARAVLADAGPVEVVTCVRPPDLHAALDALADRTLVVAGGDGSVHVVVDALDRRGQITDVMLGLVPLGTGNDLARTLDIPLDPTDAARTIIGGAPTRLDLVRTPTGTVVNAAHAGIGVAAAARAGELKGVLGPAAYPAGALAAGASAEPVRLRVEVDGVTVGDGELLLVGVGNGRTVGGGTVLFPQADLTDGLMEVVAVADGGVWERLRLGLAARNGEHPDLDGVLTARGAEVVVTGATAWNDDGELGAPLDGRRLTVEAGAWCLLR
jgi:YegS/Rv2252/BmrU family lipid kinase